MVLRPVQPADLDALLALRREPCVMQWWGSLPAVAEDEFFGDGVTSFVIELDGAIAGAIQYHEEDAPDYRHAGIDVFVATACQDRGIGSEALRVLARHLIEDRGHHRLTIDPAVANARAIRAYERVGFRAVGIMRRYERGQDGTWHDALLMDLLAGELT